MTDLIHPIQLKFGGTPTSFFVQGLHNLGLQEQDINYVVCTSGKTNKIGNLNIFNNAVCIVASEISKGDKYLTHGFHEVSFASCRM